MLNNNEESTSVEDSGETREWVKYLKKSLHNTIEEKVTNWSKVVIELGEEDVELDKWVEIFKSQVDERCSELVNDVIEMKSLIVHNVEELLDRAQNYSKQLGLENNINLIDPNVKYYKLRRELQKKVDSLEKTLNEKTKEIDNLLTKQQDLCTLLQKVPMSLKKSPFPSQKQIEKLQQYVESLEQDKFDREEEYINLKSGIVEISKQLEMTTPKSDFERDILSSTKCEYDLSLDNLKLMRTHHEDLKVQLADRKQEIDTLMTNLEDLWIKLELSRSQLVELKDNHRDYSLSTLKALRGEMRRLEVLKKDNLKVFVEKLREELNVLWKNCYHNYTIDDELYQCFVCDSYSEDMLAIHEMEVEKWKRYYEKNEELLKLFTKHQKLWNTMLEMENKNTDDVNRYKNRGGQLLREEKERNKLSKKIPSMEDEIKNLATSYENLHGVPFTIFGVAIVDFIENLHAQREQERKIKLSARKTKVQDALTPAKSSMNLFPSSRVLPTPKSTTTCSSLKRKLEKPATTGKKLKVQEGTFFSEIRSIQPTSVNRTRRLSREKARRVAKCLKYLNKSNTKNNNEENNDTVLTDYNAFERDLTSKEGGRSTLKGSAFLETLPTINLIPATPQTPRINPAATSEKTPKSDGKSTSNKKLAMTPGKLKLCF